MTFGASLGYTDMLSWGSRRILRRLGCCEYFGVIFHIYHAVTAFAMFLSFHVRKCYSFAAGIFFCVLANPTKVFMYKGKRFQVA